MSTDDKDFIQQVRNELDEACDDLDAATCSRLNQARQQALEARQASRSRWLLPIGGLTTAAAIGILSVNLWTTQPAQHPTQQPKIDLVEDMELLSGTEELEFFENLEFYQWLEDEKPVT